MRAYLFNLWDELRNSFWFVPTLFAAAAALLAWILPGIDAERSADLPSWVQMSTEAARATLGTIAGTMIGTTGTVFSITIVALSLASQQFGPRLLRRFMHDLPTQLTLGLLLATGFYALLVLRLVDDREGGGGALPVSTLASVALAVASLATLIFFIHHVAVLIQAPHVVAAVAQDLDDALDRLFPEKIGESPETDAAAADEPPPTARLEIASTQEGYIQAVSGDALMELAGEEDLVIRLEVRPGDFLATGDRLASLSKDGVGDERAERIAARLNDAVIVGVRRTPRQDLEAAVNELVEVAVRALSPGVNDPFTAINCIDRLGAALGRLAGRRMPAAERYDGNGRLRLLVRAYAFPDVLDTAFQQIRQHGRDSVAVTIRLLEALAAIAPRIRRPEDRQAMLRLAEMVAAHAEATPAEPDRRDIADRFERVQALLGAR